MIYNNLLFFLVVILIFSTNSIPESPQMGVSYAIFLFAIKAFIYQRWAKRSYSKKTVLIDSNYFALEQKFTIGAVISFSFDIYVLDAKYYLAQIPFAENIPVLVKTGGLALFFFYLSLLWVTARKSYHYIFSVTPENHYTPLRFLANNIKNNLPIILPWLLITFLLDLFQLIPLPILEKVPLSQWAEPITFLLFFLFLATVFPAMVKYLWNLTPFPPGPEKNHIRDFCNKHGFTAEILLWPLFEGRVLTAGVMGISKKFRYLLITPAIINALNTEELEAVLAHEIGHVKKHHLQLYLVLFLGFGLLLSMIANPLLYLLLNTNFFYKLISFANEDLNAGIAFWGTVPLFFIMLIYFRYVFGFFMRNFERQADLYVFEAIGNSRDLINSFEKIGALTGKRNTPSWHHFGIGQRIDYLEKCQQKPSLIKRHHKKVYFSLLLYIVVLVGGAGILKTMPADLYESGMEVRFVEAVLSQKIRQDPDNALWYRLLGDLQQERKKDIEAIKAYSKALILDPANPEIMNNYAWLLLVTEKNSFRDEIKALSLAVAAANRSQTGYIFDTLATAYWANGNVNEAVASAKKAILIDPANSNYYEQQIEKFTTSQYK